MNKLDIFHNYVTLVCATNEIFFTFETWLNAVVQTH